MSNFLNSATKQAFQVSMLVLTDERNISSYSQWNVPGRQATSPWADGVLWAAPRGIGGTFGGNITGDSTGSSGAFESYQGFDESGGRQMKKIIGQTLDSTGAPLGNCIIQGFVSSSDLFVGQTTSDTAGYYELPTQYTVAHYVVAYKAGSPDISGTSVNTLIPV